MKPASYYNKVENVVEEADENTSVTSILNMINLVSSRDKRLQSVEKCVGKFDEIKNTITSLTSRVVSTEKDIKESQRKITEVESGIQGVGNLFDNLTRGSQEPVSFTW